MVWVVPSWYLCFVLREHWAERHIAVLSSEVTLPVVIQQMFVWSRLSARDAGGTETKKGAWLCP